MMTQVFHKMIIPSDILLHIIQYCDIDTIIHVIHIIDKRIIRLNPILSLASNLQQRNKVYPLTDEYVIEYMKRIITSRDLEFEARVTDTKLLTEYSKCVGRIKSIEDKILSNPIQAVYYTEEVIGDRWLPLEERIYDNPYALELYIERVIKSCINGIEESLCRCSESLFLYVMNVSYDITSLCLSPGGCYLYASLILQNRWIEYEHVILTSPKYTYLYARDVISGPWTEGEMIILSDPKYAYLYARDVIRTRWIECEHILSAKWRLKYDEFVIKNGNIRTIKDLYHTEKSI